MRYILSIDQSTAGSKALIVDERGVVAEKKSLPHAQYHPSPGRVEHDAEEIYQNVVSLIDEVKVPGVAALAIANQRETTVLWDRATGEPVCPAVVWQDVRGEALCGELKDYAGKVLGKTGLKLSPYYPAAKLATVLMENPALKQRAGRGEILAGTVDTYLIYRMTAGHVFATDVSNASRTQLMNLETLSWDGELLDIFSIPRAMLAKKILHSDANFGDYLGIPIAAVMGDSHAALFGHGCHGRGMVKASYGTGSSIMMNVGGKPVFSGNGLSASVGYAQGGRVCYVLEGNITCSADTLTWLRDQLGLIDDVQKVNEIASQVEDAGGVQLVPAFSGLGAPYFDTGARAILCGMSRGTNKAHVVRAALESIAQQNADVLDAMARDLGQGVRALSADGGASVNPLVMQLQSDLANCQVRVSAEKDLTALGAAYMAGLGAGIFDSFDEIAGRAGHSDQYGPQMGDERRAQMRGAWADAVKRAR